MKLKLCKTIEFKFCYYSFINNCAGDKVLLNKKNKHGLYAKKCEDLK